MHFVMEIYITLEKASLEDDLYQIWNLYFN